MKSNQHHAGQMTFADDRNRRTRRCGPAALAGLLVALALALAPPLVPAQLAPTRVTTDTIASIYGDTTDYARVLAQYVDDEGRVDYAALQRGSAALDAFLERAAAMDERRVHVRWPGDSENARRLRREQLAFLINVYNARVLQTVIRNYPIEQRPRTLADIPANSLRQVPGAFDATTFTLAGEAVTLDELERTIIRHRFAEPLAPLALNKAALGSAPLRREPYTGARLEEQLADQARRVVERSAADGALPAVLAAVGEELIRTGAAEEPANTDDATTETRHARLALRTLASENPLPALVSAPSAPAPFDWTLNEAPR